MAIDAIRLITNNDIIVDAIIDTSATGFGCPWDFTVLFLFHSLKNIPAPNFLAPVIPTTTIYICVY